MRLPPLYVSEVLNWADAFYARHGRWPTRNDGKILGQLGLTWSAVHQALRVGGRGLPRFGSLARLLLERRDRRHKGLLPRFTIRRVLAWADAFHARTGGRWPTIKSGPIPEAPGETWRAVGKALIRGRRGLPGGSSLARLLAERRGVRNHMGLPDLTVEQVLHWADRYQRRTGQWPTVKSGPIPGARYGETWATVTTALIDGTRGLAGYGSLARLLARERGVPNRKARPPLSEARIARWARAHRSRTGRWPGHLDGAIVGSGGETWSAVESALKAGGRGLPGGDSLYRLLLRHGRTGRLAGAQGEQILNVDAVAAARRGPARPPTHRPQRSAPRRRGRRRPGGR